MGAEYGIGDRVFVLTNDMEIPRVLEGQIERVTEVKTDAGVTVTFTVHFFFGEGRREAKSCCVFSSRERAHPVLRDTLESLKEHYEYKIRGIGRTLEWLGMIEMPKL